MYNNYDPNNLEYQEAYRQAELRVKAKMGFYSHLTSYILVNGFLIVIYLLTSPGGYPWFIWPMLGWGIGLAFHFAGIFAFGNANAADTRRRMIEEEMRRMGMKPGTSYPTGNVPYSQYSGSNVQPFPPVAPDRPSSSSGIGNEMPPDRH